MCIRVSYTYINVIRDYCAISRGVDPSRNLQFREFCVFFQVEFSVSASILRPFLADFGLRIMPAILAFN